MSIGLRDINLTLEVDSKDAPDGNFDRDTHTIDVKLRRTAQMDGGRVKKDERGLPLYAWEIQISTSFSSVGRFTLDSDGVDRMLEDMGDVRRLIAKVERAATEATLPPEPDTPFVNIDGVKYEEGTPEYDKVIEDALAYRTLIVRRSVKEDGDEDEGCS